MNITGFHDSALCCVGAVKNSLDIYSLPWGARCYNIKQCLQSTIVFLRHITAIKSVNTIGKDEVLPHANALIQL